MIQLQTDARMSPDSRNVLAEYRNAVISNNQSALDEAAATLFKTYSPVIYQLGLKLWCSRPQRHDLADELTQQTLIKICKYAEQYDPTRSPDGWIKQIARRTAIDMGRRSSSREALVRSMADVSEETEAYAVEQHTRREPTALSMLCSKEGIQQIELAIEQLPARARTLVQLRIDDVRQREIAVVLDMLPATVKTATYYALRSLAQKLAEQGIVTLHEKKAKGGTKQAA